ncbi:GIY-YIG nuclease family protein [Maribacter sp. 2-571]|uniref:GIY-YIG nuclease family protein n=1 Tax=Maribacter sp. 2-571 TaxID=3417569 RepID=UPI003D34584D
MHYLYILYSKKADRYYVGETPELDNRLRLHNQHHFKKGFTKAADDWKIVLSKECGSKRPAVFLERFIKRMKSRKFIEKVCNDPTILDDILSKKQK